MIARSPGPGNFPESDPAGAPDAGSWYNCRDMLVFGPVPSRRLGASLGINNIPPKICSYSCVYCQIGATPHLSSERKTYYPPEEIEEKVRRRLGALKDSGQTPDFLAFVPDGEPTLDVNLGRTLRLLKPFGIRIAVLTNATLMDREDVRKDLLEADWVSLKVDAVSDPVWQKVNRPCPDLDLERIHQGMREFAHRFKGFLVTETVLVRGANDDPGEIEKVSGFISALSPRVAYIGIPTRPPAEPWVHPPSEQVLAAAHQIFAQARLSAELITGAAGGAFGFTGDVEKDLLGITSVHPMSERQVREFLSRAGAGWCVMEELLAAGRILELTYRGEKYYLRKLEERG